MRKKDEKEKIVFDENITLGETIEELKTADAVDKMAQSDYFTKITKDLSEEEKQHVLKETRLHVEKYQNFLHQFAKFMDTPEGKKEFIEYARKKFGGK